MSSPALDPLALLKSLDERVNTAADHFTQNARNPPTARDTPPSLEELVPGAERLRLAGGECLRVTSRCELAGERSTRGFVCPADKFTSRAPGSAFSILARDAAWSAIDPEKIAYVDTETTGLSGGSGTYVFLIGIGRFERGAFVVRQYFMEDYTEEPALIEAVSEEMNEAEALVSYNGKCFDLPLMQTRWRLHRRRPRFPRLHLDLLYPARRLWRLKLPDCRLDTVEREILGVMRYSDIESWRIPSIYFDYPRGVGRERILPVLDHHAQDIFSLAALGRTFVHAVSEPGDPRFGHPGEQWGLARIFHAAGLATESIEALERAALNSNDEDFRFRIAMHLARMHRRMGRIDEAVRIWKARVHEARHGRIDPLVELAKHAEHDLHDFDQARQWTRRALEIIEDQSEISILIGGSPLESARPTDTLEALRHRLERLNRRLNS